jgi:hypothetical protein
VILLAQNPVCQDAKWGSPVKGKGKCRLMHALPRPIIVANTSQTRIPGNSLVRNDRNRDWSLRGTECIVFLMAVSMAVRVAEGIIIDFIVT